jgi:hypothetical protein
VVPVSEPLELPWVRIIKDMIPEILSPVVEALAELKAEYHVDRDEWIADLDRLSERLDNIERHLSRIERRLEQVDKK